MDSAPQCATTPRSLEGDRMPWGGARHASLSVRLRIEDPLPLTAAAGVGVARLEDDSPSNLEGHLVSQLSSPKGETDLQPTYLTEEEKATGGLMNTQRHIRCTGRENALR